MAGKRPKAKKKKADAQNPFALKDPAMLPGEKKKRPKSSKKPRNKGRG